MRKLNDLHSYAVNFPIYIFSLFFLLFFSCNHLHIATKYLEEGEEEKAIPPSEKAEKKESTDIGGAYLLEYLSVNKDTTVKYWLPIVNNFDTLEKRLNLAPLKKINRHKKYNITRHRIRQSQENLQNRIFEKMVTSGTMEELKALEQYAHKDYWRDTRVDTIQKVIVNRILDSEETVFGEGADETWVAHPPELPSVSEALIKKGYSCDNRSYVLEYNVNYKDATTILHDYINVVLPQNYSRLWAIKSNIWDIFQAYQSYCEMEEFKTSHPYDDVVQDCWYDEVSVALCDYDLAELLKFHKEHPHSAFNTEIARRILCLSLLGNDLSEAQKTQLEDITNMFKFQRKLNTCSLANEIEETVEQLTHFATQYEGHRIAFELVARTIDYYVGLQKYTIAQDLIAQFRPLFKDVEVCKPSFSFQNRKQAFFDKYEQLLERRKEEKDMPMVMPVSTWNTATNDEYALTSWGETSEVFFVRQNPSTKETYVMTSINKGVAWTKPIPIPKLSIAEDVEPLSVSGDGRMILLKSEGKLYQSNRKLVGRSWSTPEPLSMPNRFAENAWISPNDSLMLLEYYTSSITVLGEPNINIAVAELMPDGAYGNLKMLKENTDFPSPSKTRPIMALDGRMMFYVSEEDNTWGGEEMYSIRLENPYAWEQMDEPLNIGVPINTLYADYGVTYLSEYTGFAYYHKKEQCGVNRTLDIWQFEVDKKSYPKNALRLAGIVLDEHKKPISEGEGFMEFIPDRNLAVHYEPISSKGNYTYTVKGNTAVVRLHPEIPGYYSDQETEHFLANAPQGEIIRDTFYLTSFDYIRKKFKLTDCTFYQDQAIFDQPDKTKPELTRLARIAERMGANLELVGHTDNIGTPKKNLQLSINRIETVKDFLVNSAGFPAEKIRALGKGATEPICDNGTEEGRRCNRRVEVRFKMPKLKEKK